MRVWDLPLRLFHWSFMICVVGAIASGKMGNWDVHERFGLAIMGLVSFRIIWGFIGSHTARFRNFLKSPMAVIATAKALWRKQSDNHPGHSAVGGYATLALLFIPLMMAVTGAFSTDDILFDGPFYHLMPQWAGQAGMMHNVGEKLIFIIIIAHLGALAYYYFRLRKNLVKPMVTGKSDHAKGEAVSLSSTKTALGIILLIGLVIIAQFATQLRPVF